jgi:hypothetical protein
MHAREIEAVYEYGYEDGKDGVAEQVHATTKGGA